MARCHWLAWSPLQACVAIGEVALKETATVSSCLRPRMVHLWFSQSRPFPTATFLTFSSSIQISTSDTTLYQHTNPRFLCSPHRCPRLTSLFFDQTLLHNSPPLAHQPLQDSDHSVEGKHIDRIRSEIRLRSDYRLAG